MASDDLSPHINRIVGINDSKGKKCPLSSVPDVSKKQLLTLTVMTVQEDHNVEIENFAELREKSHEFAQILHGTLLHYLGASTPSFDVQTKIEIASRDMMLKLRHPSHGADRLDAAETFLRNRINDMDFTLLHFADVKGASLSSAPLYVNDGDKSRAVHWEGRGIIYHNDKTDGLEQTASLLLNQIEKCRQSMKMKDMLRFRPASDCDDGETFEYHKYFHQEHFFAVLAPLLMPLVMPMILGLKKELERYRKLTSAKIKTD